MLFSLTLAALAIVPQVSGHAAFFHPSMWGFNVTSSTYSYDNRPVAPIKNMNFSQWWFHGHLDQPPNPGDIFELPAGKPATAEIACNKGATSYFNSSGTSFFSDPSNPESPCPNAPSTQYHTNNKEDLMGCALAIAYKNDVNAVKPEDFAVFSVNHTCVWTRHTDFQVPARMPPCPEGGCICAFFWVHSPLSGGEENYMNGFKCNVTGSTSTTPISKSKVARRCGSDLPNKKPFTAPANCTYGAKTPFYWFNKEGNNMFEGDHSPPVYNDRYNFVDGPQDDIFIDSYDTMPDPAPNAAMPTLANIPSPVGLTLRSNNTPSTVGESIPRRIARRVVPASNPASADYDERFDYKRDMSDKHLSSNAARRYEGLRVNVESRRRFVGRRSPFW